jgi:EAL domain-containing protein (putative c-di-GMP-specific phosphodiesterase class I)
MSAVPEIEVLRKMNCDIVQGYYYSKPLRPEEIAAKYYL